MTNGSPRRALRRVDASREQFLPGSALAGDQDGSVRMLRGALGEIEDRACSRARTDKEHLIGIREPGGKRGVPRLELVEPTSQRLIGRCSLERDLHVGGTETLLQEVERAEPERLRDGVHVTVTGHDDDLDLRRHGANPLEHGEPVRLGKLQVEQEDIRRRGRNTRQRVPRVIVDGTAVAEAREVLAELVGERAFVVENRDMQLGHRSSPVAGSSREYLAGTRAP